MKELLIKERQQLIQHWRTIDPKKFEKAAQKVLNTFATGLKKKEKSSAIRHFHDVLGYMAKGDAHRGGLCVGAPYRTEFFTITPQELRTGLNDHPRNLIKIHIEHTVPISVLVEQLDAVGAGAWRISNLIAFLLTHSVVTATLWSEGRVRRSDDYSATGIIKQGYACKSDVFNSSHCDEGLPFMRYWTKDHALKVYDVLSGDQISLSTFTTNDHLDRVRELVVVSGLRTAIQL